MCVRAETADESVKAKCDMFSLLQLLMTSSNLPVPIRLGSDEEETSNGDGGYGTGTQTVTQPKSKTKQPSLYRVLLLNDDYTPMDFVIHILQKFFHKEYNEAAQIMLQVHTRGAGVAGVFSFEVAETKVFQVNQYSRQNQHPLKCTMEKV